MACKLVTSFQNNQNLKDHPRLPNIMATILLFDTDTGKLKAIFEGTEITGWRTAAASLVATKYLYFNRFDENTNKKLILSIIGCGVQGRIHAIGMLNMFANIMEIYLWNRSPEKAIALQKELINDICKNSKNPNCKILITNNVMDCVRNADVIVTGTYAEKPILTRAMIKNATVHINAIGAGPGNHHSELHDTIYECSKIYVDNWAAAKTELKTLNYKIDGEIGEIINGIKSVPPDNCITIFQSMGMAVEDATVAQMIYECYKNKNV